MVAGAAKVARLASWPLDQPVLASCLPVTPGSAEAFPAAVRQATRTRGESSRGRSRVARATAARTHPCGRASAFARPASSERICRPSRATFSCGQCQAFPTCRLAEQALHVVRERARPSRATKAEPRELCRRTAQGPRGTFARPPHPCRPLRMRIGRSKVMGCARGVAYKSSVSPRSTAPNPLSAYAPIGFSSISTEKSIAASSDMRSGICGCCH